MRNLFFGLTIGFLLISCGVEKRLYRPGYYFHSASHNRSGIGKSNNIENYSAEFSTETDSSITASISPQRETAQTETVLEESHTVFIPPPVASADSASRDNNVSHQARKANFRNEKFADDMAFLFFILVEIAGIALMAWLATLVFPTIPIWLAIVIGLLAFYALLVILYLIFARNEV